MRIRIAIQLALVLSMNLTAAVPNQDEWQGSVLYGYDAPVLVLLLIICALPRGSISAYTSKLAVAVWPGLHHKPGFSLCTGETC